LFDIIDTVRGFKPFIVVVFVIEIDEIRFGLSLTATAWTVSGLMTHLSTLETIIVCISWGWSSSVVLRGWSKASCIPLCLSSIVLTPVQGSSMSQVHWYCYIVHPAGCVSRIVLRLRGSLAESRSSLLQESSLVSLISLIEEHSWSLEIIGLWKHIEDSTVEPSGSLVRVAGTEYVVDQNFRPGG